MAFRYTGRLRPGKLSPTRLVPAHIQKPDYAHDGQPKSSGSWLPWRQIEVKDAKELFRVQHLIGTHSSAAPGIRNTPIQVSGRLKGTSYHLGDTVFLGHIRHGGLHRPPAAGDR